MDACFIIVRMEWYHKTVHARWCNEDKVRGAQPGETPEQAAECLIDENKSRSFFVCLLKIQQKISVFCCCTCDDAQQ